jgi:hypothetical protein
MRIRIQNTGAKNRQFSFSLLARNSNLTSIGSVRMPQWAEIGAGLRPIIFVKVVAGLGGG